MQSLTEKTLIPMSMLAGIIICVMYVTTMHNDTAANTDSIKELKIKQDNYNSDILEIKEKLAIIELELKKIRK